MLLVWNHLKYACELLASVNACVFSHLLFWRYSGDTCTFTHTLKNMRSQNAVVSRCIADLSSEVRLRQFKHFYFQTGCGCFAFVCEPYTICAYAEMFAARFQRTLHNYEAIQRHQQQPTANSRPNRSINAMGWNTLHNTHTLNSLVNTDRVRASDQWSDVKLNIKQWRPLGMCWRTYTSHSLSLNMLYDTWTRTLHKFINLKTTPCAMNGRRSHERVDGCINKFTLR